MPTKSKSRLQAKSQQRALEKLKNAGLYSGKIDRRKNPTRYQQRLIAQYKDVVSGKATVVKPKNPQSYKSLFRVKGDKVIVPRAKGERVKINKRGNIVSERKNAVGQTVQRSYRRIKSDNDLSNEKHTMFFVPFIRGRNADGKPILEWKRFVTKDSLINIMGGYENRQKNPYINWQDYVVEERVVGEGIITPDLEKRLDKKLGSAKRRRIRFDE